MLLISSACSQAEVASEQEEPKMAGQVNATLDYIEFPATDMAATKAFYEEVLGWTFTDYGPDYTAFARAEAGIDGGFTTQTPVGGSPGKAGGTLAVLYADDLEAMLARVEAAGGTIVQPIFSFPGGRRFHFTDPSGNELAVWTLAAEE
jgi:hypothetical protein